MIFNNNHEEGKDLHGPISLAPILHNDITSYSSNYTAIEFKQVVVVLVAADVSMYGIPGMIDFHFW